MLTALTYVPGLVCEKFGSSNLRLAESDVQCCNSSPSLQHIIQVLWCLHWRYDAEIGTANSLHASA